MQREILCKFAFDIILVMSKLLHDLNNLIHQIKFLKICDEKELIEKISLLKNEKLKIFNRQQIIKITIRNFKNLYLESLNRLLQLYNINPVIDMNHLGNYDEGDFTKKLMYGGFAGIALSTAFGVLTAGIGPLIAVGIGATIAGSYNIDKEIIKTITLNLDIIKNKLDTQAIDEINRVIRTAKDQFNILNNSISPYNTNNLSGDYLLFKSELIKYRFYGFFHMTTFNNLLSIFNDQRIYAREKITKVFENLANEDIIENTPKSIRNKARFYLRPNTPTYYNFYKKEVLIILSWDILNKNSYISNSNAAKNESKILNIETDGNQILNTFDFKSIFSFGPIVDDSKKEYIIGSRNAELLIPDFQDFNNQSIRYIVFSNQQNAERFLSYISNSNYFIEKSKIVVNESIF